MKKTENPKITNLEPIPKTVMKYVFVVPIIRLKDGLK